MAIRRRDDTVERLQGIVRVETYDAPPSMRRSGVVRDSSTKNGYACTLQGKYKRA
jgi:hypothetical protein